MFWRLLFKMFSILYKIVIKIIINDQIYVINSENICIAVKEYISIVLFM